MKLPPARLTTNALEFTAMDQFAQVEDASQWRDELKAEARAAGVRWKDVASRARELVTLDAEIRESYEGVRARAWQLVCHYAGWSGRDDFWRVGFQRCFPRITRAGEQDYTAVRRYDEVFASIAEEWPQWRERDAAELFDELFAPYRPRRSRAELWGEALADVAEWMQRAASEINTEGDWPCEF